VATRKPIFLRIDGLSAELGQPVRLIRTWMSERVIPFTKPGRRTILFQLDKVLEALAKFEVKAVGQGLDKKNKSTNAVVRTTGVEE
jgi:hypothetical protein